EGHRAARPQPQPQGPARSMGGRSHSRQALGAELAERTTIRGGREQQRASRFSRRGAGVLRRLLPFLSRRTEGTDRRHRISERRRQGGRPRRSHQHHALSLSASEIGRGRKQHFMLNLSIKARLLLLSSGLVLLITASTLYLTHKLTDNANAVARNAELAKLIDDAQDVRNTFGEYRYWITDLAVSLLRQSEINANDTYGRLLKQLDLLASRRPDIAAVLKEEIARFDEQARLAVERYTNDQRVLGNIALAEARQHSVVINDRIAALVDALNAEVVRARDNVVADVARTNEVAYVIVAIAIVLGLGFTWIVLRSILVPLNAVMAAMDGVTAGQMNTPIPKVRGGEIGAMAKTLEL